MPAAVFANATFIYDGDGHRVKSVMQTDIATTSTYFPSTCSGHRVGNYYEMTDDIVTKYYGVYPDGSTFAHRVEELAVNALLHLHRTAFGAVQVCERVEL
jgi:hypothetical protein